MNAPEQPPDSLVWLEEVRGERALAWVKTQNERTLSILRSNARFLATYDTALAIHRAGRTSSLIELFGGHVYSLLSDSAHPRGLWRRASLDSFLSAEPAWEPVLDFDALAKAEGKPWTFGQPPKCYRTRCMIYLGADPEPQHAATL